MPATPHIEQHFSGSRLVRDVVIGMSDGLTVPFALAAGLSGAIDSSRVVVMAGLAEVAAGTIAMGLGGYLAALGDAEHYASEHAPGARWSRSLTRRSPRPRRCSAVWAAAQGIPRGARLQSRPGPGRIHDASRAGSIRPRRAPRIGTIAAPTSSAA
jgi:hypothetical protein